MKTNETVYCVEYSVDNREVIIHRGIVLKNFVGPGIIKVSLAHDDFPRHFGDELVKLTFEDAKLVAVAKLEASAAYFEQLSRRCRDSIKAVTVGEESSYLSETSFHI